MMDKPDIHAAPTHFVNWLESHARLADIRALKDDEVEQLLTPAMLGKLKIREYWVLHAMADLVNDVCDPESRGAELRGADATGLSHTTRESIRTAAIPDESAQQDALRKLFARYNHEDEITLSEKLGLDPHRTQALFKRIDSYYAADPSVVAEAASRVERTTGRYFRDLSPPDAWRG